MTDMHKLLAELKAKIEISRQTLLEQEKAVQIVEAMISNSGSSLNVPLHSSYSNSTTEISVTPPISAVFGGPIELDSLAPPITFKDEVVEIVKRLGDQEFTGAQIEAVFKKMDKVITGKYPKSRIASVLSALVDSRMLVRTFAGAGHVPHRYKIRKEETMAAEEKSENTRSEQQIKHDELFAE